MTRPVESETPHNINREIKPRNFELIPNEDMRNMLQRFDTRLPEQENCILNTDVSTAIFRTFRDINMRPYIIPPKDFVEKIKKQRMVHFNTTITETAGFRTVYTREEAFAIAALTWVQFSFFNPNKRIDWELLRKTTLEKTGEDPYAEIILTADSSRKFETEMRTRKAQIREDVLGELNEDSIPTQDGEILNPQGALLEPETSAAESQEEKPAESPDSKPQRNEKEKIIEAPEPVELTKLNYFVSVVSDTLEDADKWSIDKFSQAASQIKKSDNTMSFKELPFEVAKNALALYEVDCGRLLKISEAVELSSTHLRTAAGLLLAYAEKYPHLDTAGKVTRAKLIGLKRLVDNLPKPPSR